AAFSGGVLVGGIGSGLLRRGGAHPAWILAVVGLLTALTAFANLGPYPPLAPPQRRSRLARPLLIVGLVLALAFLVENGLEAWSALFLGRTRWGRGRARCRPFDGRDPRLSGLRGRPGTDRGGLGGVEPEGRPALPLRRGGDPGGLRADPPPRSPGNRRLAGISRKRGHFQRLLLDWSSLAGGITRRLRGHIRTERGGLVQGRRQGGVSTPRSRHGCEEGKARGARREA